MTPAQLAELIAKYETLVELRRTRAEAMARGWNAFPLEARPGRRRTMQALAARFPGSLRELDDASLEALSHRLVALRLAALGADCQPWMPACSLFHEGLREALAARRGAPSPFWSERESLQRQLARPPTGRLLDVVWTAVAETLRITPGEAERLVYPNAPARGVRR